MKIIKSLFKVKEETLFDKKGNVTLTEDTAYLMDCILTIYASGIEVKTLHRLNLELYRCSVYINYPDLKKVINYLCKEGLLSMGDFSRN
mgnify:CR=1 FL=1